MKLAVVTGGSRGLGRSLCEEFRNRDYNVVEYSRSAPHPWSVSVDLSVPENIHQNILKSLRGFRPADFEEVVVVNNAGTLDPIGPSSKKSFDKILCNITTNFTGPILALSLIVAHFQGARCRKVIASISSGAAQKSYFGWSLYCAAKAGMEAYIRALALEQQSEDAPFTPIIIDPGVIDTEMQAAIRGASPDDFPEVERFKRRKSEGKLAAPEAVARQVLDIIARPDLTPGGRYEV